MEDRLSVVVVVEEIQFGDAIRNAPKSETVTRRLWLDRIWLDWASFTRRQLGR